MDHTVNVGKCYTDTIPSSVVPDLISQLLDPVVDPWLGRETCYELIPVAESYSGPRISFPLSVSHTNSLLNAFKEHQVRRPQPHTTGPNQPQREQRERWCPGSHR